MQVYSEIVCDSVFEDACVQLYKTLVHRVNGRFYALRRMICLDVLNVWY